VLPGTSRLISYCPNADTYTIHIKLSPADAEVLISTVDASTDCTVPAIFVFVTFAAQVPVRVTFDGFGTKQDVPF
jgi:hypothetical protein